MNLDNYIKYLTKLRNKNNAGKFQVVKWDFFEKKHSIEGRTTPITKKDIELNEDMKTIAIESNYHPCEF